MIRKWTAKPARCFAAAALLLFLGGCAVFGQRHQMDEPLPGDSLPAFIRRGETTKQAILEQFGPPAAVARRGTTMVYPAPGPSKRGRIDVQSEAFLALFSADRALKDSEIVYYYESSRLKALGFLFVPIIGGGYNSTRIAVERLWILLDEKTGLVEEYVFRGEDLPDPDKKGLP